MPVAMIAKPALSSARLTAESWVTTSSQSRPSSSIRSTPASWPWARLRRLTTAVISAGSSCMATPPLGVAGPAACAIVLRQGYPDG